MILMLFGYNGAKCLKLNESTEETVFHLPISKKFCTPMIDYCKEKNLKLIFYHHGRCVTEERLKDDRVINIFAEITNNPDWEYVKEYNDVHALDITNGLFITEDESAADAILKDLTATFAGEDVHLVKTDCASTDHHQFYVEILNPGANKGKALAALCNKINIKPEKVIVFGDGENDLEMFEFAGRGVCMANACERLKQQAAYITPYTNDQEGVHLELQSLMK
ncbi:phosphatase MPN [Acrasis kona]|uniref:Phosphatase MPN n=1 Tax=Acrasis kona TaxID=1008807 RepID=A0AAW2ZIN5_9EUKA